MKLILQTLALVLIWTGCFKKQIPEPVDENVKSTLALKNISAAPKALGSLLKEQREALYFAASLEREALKLITKTDSYERGTLFSIISAAFENEAGGRKPVPNNAGCNRYRVEKSKNRLDLYRVCQSPATRIATVEVNAVDDMNFVFKSREWGSVIGSSVALTNPDIECRLQLKNKKLESMDCKNWSYVVTENQLSATEIKLKTFHFERKSDLQFELKGGFFKDLTENKKISVIVPLQGQIKLFEKEIEVIDDFADIVNPPVVVPPKPDPILIGGPKAKKTEEQQVDQPEENRQEIEKNIESDQSNSGVPGNGLPKDTNRGR